MRPGFLFILILAICTVQIGCGLVRADSAQNNVNARQTEEPEGLSQAKQNLVLRAEFALTQAKSSLDSTADKDAAARLEKFAGEVETFETAVNRASSIPALEPLRVRLKELEAQSVAMVKEAGTAGFTVMETILLVGLGMALIAAFASIGAFVLSTIHSRSLIHGADSALQRCTKSLDSLQQDVSGIRGHSEGIKQRLKHLHEELTQHIATAKTRSDEEKRKPPAVDPPGAAVKKQPEVFDTATADVELTSPTLGEPVFPALVADYVSRIGDTRKQSLEVGFGTDTLVQTADGTAPFMLIADSEKAGVGIVLPKERLQKGQDFSNYYKGYYDCADPFAGAVYILAPARVEQSGSGWRLCQKGSMEIR